ncbi:MAG: hypothetical protein ACE1ZA_16330, partial [Pseudomonadales bacterium]
DSVSASPQRSYLRSYCGLDLSYMDLGDGLIETPSACVIGNLNAEYDEHWGLIFDLQFRWGS